MKITDWQREVNKQTIGQRNLTKEVYTWEVRAFEMIAIMNRWGNAVQIVY